MWYVYVFVSGVFSGIYIKAGEIEKGSMDQEKRNRKTIATLFCIALSLIWPLSVLIYLWPWRRHD